MMFRIAPASLAVLAIFNVVSTLADGLQLDNPADSPKTCEADLAQCNVDKTLNAAAVLSRLQSGTIKMVFTA